MRRVGKKHIRGLVLGIFLIIFIQLPSYAASISWLFTTSGNYTPSNASKVEIANGVAKLIAVDQTDDDNTSTGFGGGTHNETQWDGINSWIEADVTTNVWELPDNASSSGWTDMTGNVLLMHMNEQSAGGAPGGTDVEDFSGNGNHGSESGGITFGASGKLSTALQFDGINDYVDLGTGCLVSDSWTVSFWLYPLSPDDYARVFIQGSDGCGSRQIMVTWHSGHLEVRTVTDGSQGDPQAATGTVTDGAWSHFVWTYDGTHTLFVNGEPSSGSVTGPSVGIWGNNYIGCRADSINYWTGRIDEVAIYNNRSLSAEDIKTIYDRQAPAYSGYFDSRVMDAGGTAAWDSISWTPQRPLYKELPDNDGIETAYPAGNADMTGNVLLMHMNEQSAGGAPGGTDVEDFSGNGNHGNESGGITFGASGKLSTALQFDGINDYVDLGTGCLVSDSWTVSLWLYPLSPDNYERVFIQGSDGCGSRQIMVTWHSGHLEVRTVTDGSQGDPQAATGTVTESAWSHFVWTYDGTHALYINGEPSSGSVTGPSVDIWGNNYIGCLDGTTNYWTGKMDEVAIYSRSLSGTEILDHYKRGAVRLKYQVRSGSANPPTGSFIGPDSTTGTYYSELSNSTTGLPSLSLTNVDNNQYFQYKACLETDNSSYLPELKSVVIGPRHYPGDNPTVQNNASQSYVDLDSLSETLGAGNEGSVKYQISDDGTNWYYWNSSNWVAASGYSQTNTAAEVNTNCGQFDDDVGSGTFYFKAFLHSDAAAQQVELDQVDLGYTPIVISVSVGDPTFAFGSVPLNAWQLAQTSLITNDGTVTETFIGQISQYTDGGNNWTISDATNGADQIRAQWSITSDTGPWTDITAYDSDFTIATNVAASGNETLWLRIQTPTSTTSYTEYSSTLTVTALEY
jgi:Concanavalin A-like lectin/glucanases superfamily